MKHHFELGDYVEWTRKNGEYNNGTVIDKLYSLDQRTLTEIVVATPEGYRIIKPNEEINVGLHEEYGAPYGLDQEEADRLDLYKYVLKTMALKCDMNQMLDYIYKSDGVDDYDPSEYIEDDEE